MNGNIIRRQMLNEQESSSNITPPSHAPENQNLLYHFPLTGNATGISGNVQYSNISPYTEVGVEFSSSGCYIDSASDVLRYVNSRFDQVQSVYCEVRFTGTNSQGYMYIFSINDYSGSQSWLGIGRNNSSGKIQITYGESGYGYTDSTLSIPLNLNTDYKIALAVSSSGGQLAVNGTIINISTSYNPGSVQEDLYIGGSWRQRTDGLRNMRGYIKNLQLFSTKLTQDQLIEMTI